MLRLRHCLSYSFCLPLCMFCSSSSLSPQQYTREKMLSVFHDLFGTSRLRAARNWCLVTEKHDGALQFQVCKQG